MIATMRCFVAVDLNSEVVQGLREAQSELSRSLSEADDSTKVKWVSPEALHLTLKFLGDRIDVGVVPALEDALRQATRRRTAFHLQVKGVGAFPAAKSARVLWADLEAPPELDDLWQALEDRLEDVGFERERRSFTPHVTLGRVKDRDVKPDLSGALESFKERDFGSTPVGSVVLYQSTLTPTGPRYEALTRAQLEPSSFNHVAESQG